MDAKQTAIEIYVIQAVKKRREELNMSQKALSININVDEGFVGHVESPKYKTKYNFNHINEIAKVLKCSVADFMPDPFLETDCVAEYKKYHPR